MSEQQNDLQQSDDAEFVMEDAVPETPQKRGNGVAWLALLVSIVAVAAAGYTAVQNWLDRGDPEAANVASQINALEQGIADTNAAISTVDDKVSGITHPDISGEVDAVNRDVEEQLRLLRSLPTRMTTIENSVASLAGISAGARETFLLAEAEYYLQIANAQLQLANNPHLATLALRMADERVTQLSDPGLVAVRSEISDELAKMEVMEKPDLEGTTLTLASLARVVESLPVRTGRDESGDEDNVDAEQSGMQQAWAATKSAMSNIVKVTPPDEARLTLISPDAENFLRSNIALQLQAARLALLRGEQAIFEQSLDDTAALLDTYFDADSEQVLSTRETIAEIRSGVFTVEMPDISGSLRLLRQFRTLRETGE